MPSRIEDYALIGDCQSAALVGRDGSIDWLCFPRFDSGACFAALLGTEDNGRWQLAPAGNVRQVRRRYLPGTLILETAFVTDEGEVRVIDFMPRRSAGADVIRIVQGKRGRVRMKTELIIRFDYGSIVPWVRRTNRGLRATAGPDTLYCKTNVDLRGEDFRTVAEFDISPGEQVPFVLTWVPTHGDQPQERDPWQCLKETEAWWQAWAAQCTYQGPWSDAVLRSLITLKAMTYSQTGGLIAAATTSLPEQLGGCRNWDYRYCWLRDATFTLYALLVGGYTEEAQAWREWLIDAVAGKPSELQIMYGLAGERRLTELELNWLPGYEGSSPVRIGNEAAGQHQLDVYGEVMDALHFVRRAGIGPDENAWHVQRVLMDYLEADWKSPDQGIWEVRGPLRHFTHSKVMAWVAVDRGIKATERFGLDGKADRWRQLRDEIHAEVCEKGFNRNLNSFVQYYGSEEPDAALLILPLVGFLPATDSRMISTVDLIERLLGCDGFLLRYRPESNVDRLTAGEGAFLICTFWLADNLVLQGRRDEASRLFEQLLEIRNDVGLLAEQYDPAAKRMLGNFPQAFSHVGLINTARNLAETGGPAEDRPEL